MNHKASCSSNIVCAVNHAGPCPGYKPCDCDLPPSSSPATERGWEEKFNQLWAKDDVPRLRNFALEFFGNIISHEREAAKAEERARVDELIQKKRVL